MGNMCEAHHPWSLRGQTGICNPSPNWWAHQKHTEGNLTLECEMCWNSRHLSGDGCLRRHYYLDFLHVSACRRFFWWCQRAERRLYCARGVSSLRFYWKAAWDRNGIVILLFCLFSQTIPAWNDDSITIRRNHSIQSKPRDLTYAFFASSTPQAATSLFSLSPHVTLNLWHDNFWPDFRRRRRRCGRQCLWG